MHLTLHYGRFLSLLTCCTTGIEHTEEVASPDLAELFLSITFLEKLDSDADHIIATLATKDAATTIEVTTDTDMVNASHLDAMVYVCYDVVNAGLGAVRTHVAGEDTDLDDATVLGQSAELIVVEVAVMEEDILSTTVSADDRHLAQLHHIPESTHAGVAEVDDHTHLIHLLDHLSTELGETLVLVSSVSRTVADSVVVAVAEGHVVDTLIVVLLDVTEVIANTIAILNTDEERLLALGLETDSLLFGAGNATELRILGHIIINIVNDTLALLDSRLHRSVIELLLREESREELCIEEALGHLRDAHLLTVTSTHGATSRECHWRVAVSIDRIDAAVDILGLCKD